MNPPIQIFATDVNEQSIEVARIGWYSQAQVADLSPERLQRYFVPVDDGYQVHTLVRELCIFARQNLVNDPPFSRLDLISCRNVLIYFSLALQRRVLPMFHYGLKPQGYLLLGSSETVGEFTDLFSPLGNRHRIYTKLSRGPQLEINFSPDSYVPELALPRPVPSPDGAENLDPYATADQILLSRYAPACVLVNTQLEILQFRGQTGAYLEPSPGRASLNLLRMARENLRLDLRTALYQARQLEQVVERDTVALREGDRTRRIRIEVVPFTAGDPETSYYLVMFRDMPTAADLVEVEVTPADAGRVRVNPPGMPRWNATGRKTSSCRMIWKRRDRTCSQSSRPRRPQTRTCGPPTKKFSPATKSCRAPTKNCKPPKKKFRPPTKNSAPLTMSCTAAMPKPPASATTFKTC
jgi:two-component system CheB/CheR fusion protein